MFGETQRSPRRVRVLRRTAMLGMASAVLLTPMALLATSAPAQAGTGKYFAANLNPKTVSAGVTPSTVTFSFALSNESSNQVLGSANLTAPSSVTPLTVSAPTSGSAAIVGNTIQLRNVQVAPGQSSTFSFVASVAPPATASAVYTWTVQGKQSNDFNGTGNDFVLDAANSSLTTTVNQTPRADLAVAFGSGSTPADQPDPASIGNDVLYTIRITNNGPNAESSVTLDNVLTGGATIQEIPATGSGAGWSCTTVTASESTCTYGALAPGASTVIQVWAHVTDGAAPSTIQCGSGQVTGICDTASVSGSQPDPASANNSASEATTVNGTGACPPADVSCARSFINFNKPSTVTTGAAANASKWLVGTTSFPATSVTGGTIYAMDAFSTPGAYCPASLSAPGVLVQCDFEMRIDPVPTQYAGKTATLSLECDRSKCPVGTSGTGGFALVKLTDNSSSPQLLSRCDAPFGVTTPCYGTGVAANGNFAVTVFNISPGDPKFAGKCYVQCTPALA